MRSASDLSRRGLHQLTEDDAKEHDHRRDHVTER